MYQTMASPQTFQGKMVMIGFGSIGQAVLPLLLSHITLTPDRTVIFTADSQGHEPALSYNITPIVQALNKENYRSILYPVLAKGDFLLNLSVNVSSVALIELCQEIGVLYLDTCIEPWEGAYTDVSLTPGERSNYMLRESMLSTKSKYVNGSTAVVAHGANPGLVSHFVKQALLNIADENGQSQPIPTNRPEWAELAYKLGVKVIHIAEKDTQDTKVIRKPKEFVNTWSIDGFVSEGFQPAELGWGTHEKYFPHDGLHHNSGSNAAIYLNRPGFVTKVSTWTPKAGSFHGHVITHNEAISIAEYLSITEDQKTFYRPTCHYAYHPCNDAILSISEFVGTNFSGSFTKRLMRDEIDHGIDELGVLLMGHTRGAYWFGSQLSIEEARQLVPFNNATSLQVVAGVLAGIIIAIRHPNLGVVEPEELNHEEALNIAGPYLGPVVGEYSNWTPLEGRSVLFSEDVDHTDPWQFKNFRVL